MLSSRQNLVFLFLGIGIFGSSALAEEPLPRVLLLGESTNTIFGRSSTSCRPIRRMPL